MFNSLFSVIHPLEGLAHYSTIISCIDDLMGKLSSHYLVDKNAKNAAIDAIVEILQAHKDKPQE